MFGLKTGKAVGRRQRAAQPDPALVEARGLEASYANGDTHACSKICRNVLKGLGILSLAFIEI